MTSGIPYYVNLTAKNLRPVFTGITAIQDFADVQRLDFVRMTSDMTRSSGLKKLNLATG